MTNKQRRSLRSLLRDVGGAAYVEAVLMLPVLLIMWFSLQYIHDSFQSAITAEHDPRRDAWSDALAGCPGGFDVNDFGIGRSSLQAAAQLYLARLWQLLRQLDTGRLTRTSTKTVSLGRYAYINPSRGAFQGRMTLMCNARKVNITDLEARLRDDVHTALCQTLFGLDC